MAGLSQAEQARVGAAIRAAEAKTSGEIVCVLARASSDYQAYAIGGAAVCALIAPWLLIALPNLTVREIFLAQILTFACALVILSGSAIRRLLVPYRLRQRQAHRTAMEQFVIRGMARKTNRAGVLIFVSLAERYARIVADDGIAAKVDQRVWQAAVDALLTEIAHGRIADGFVVAVDVCGGVLSRHFPPSEGQDELPDRIYLI